MSKYIYKRCASVEKLIQALNNNEPTHTCIILKPKKLQGISEKNKNDFCQALAKNTTVRRLILSHDAGEGNNLEDGFLDDINKALEENSTLVDFRFSAESDDSKTLNAIQEKIAHNRIRVVTENFLPQPVALSLNEQELNERNLFRRAKNAIKYGKPNLLYSLVSKHPEASKTPINKSFGLLYIAVEYGQVDCVKALLLLKAQIDNFESQINAALFKAITENYFVMTNLLLKGGANVHATLNGFTPLHRALSYEIGKLLIDYKADLVNTSRNGWSVLHSAICNRAEAQLILYFLGLGVSVNTQNHEGKTALHLLSILSDSNLQKNINLLLKAGANPLLKDKEGCTPLDLAHDCDVFLWKTITRDYLCIRDRLNIIKYGMRANSFFGAPPEIIEHIALMVASTESLEPDTSEALVKSTLWN